MPPPDNVESYQELSMADVCGHLNLHHSSDEYSTNGLHMPSPSLPPPPPPPNVESCPVIYSFCFCCLNQHHSSNEYSTNGLHMPPPTTPPPPPPLRMLKVTHSYLRLLFLQSKSTSLIGRVLYQWTTHAPPPHPPENVESYPQLSMADVFAV